MPVPFVRGLLREGHILFANARNLHVDVGFEFGLDFEALDNLDNLGLLLGGAAISKPNFL